MNKAIYILSAVFLFSFFSCNQKEKEKGDLTDYITKNTSSVWRIEDWNHYNALMQTQYASSSDQTALDLSKLLKHLNTTQTSLITSTYRDSTYYYSLIAPQDSLLLPKDTSLYKISKEANLYKYTTKDYSFFASIKDSIIIVSDNENVLNEMLDLKKPKEVQLIKLLEVKVKSKLAGLRRETQDNGIAEWSVVDFHQTEDGFLSTGILQSADSLGYWSNLIHGQKPQPLHIASYIPSNVNSAWALAYQNADILKKQIEIYSQKLVSEEELLILEASDEIGSIALSNGVALGIKSLDEENLMQLINNSLSLEETYREAPIYKITDEELLETVKTVFCGEINLNWLVTLDDYFIFTSEIDIARAFATAHFNNLHLADTKIYKESVKNLSSKASLLYFSLDGHFPKDIQQHTALDIFGKKTQLDKADFPILVLQLNAEKDFAHLNFLAYQSQGEKLQPTRVIENFQIKLEENILNTPMYFTNHLNRRKDILVQDQANNLHLFNSSNGAKYWTKKLDGPILGEIHEVDIHRNGRKQIAFTTEKGLHILDRAGGNASPFPINFKDKVTQGLAVFDYNNNKDYRFIVIQGTDILMYDKKAKIVRGFGYTKASSNIIMPAQHLRIGNLDYLIFAEENGKLQIRNRIGKERLNIVGKYDIKNQAVEIERSGFVFYTNQREKINVNTSGSISRQKLEEDFYKTTEHGVSVFIQAQKLRINQTEIELPFGLYTDPKIYKIGSQAYVTITDTQENKVYVYNAKGSLLQGFPVYGKGAAFLADANKNEKPSLIVQTEDNTLTQYSLE